MRYDKITKIEIDDSGRLLITPETEKFTMIYRSAAEVHWDNQMNSLYSPRPREWSYLDWYKHIISLILTDCNCRLLISESTQWKNIPEELKTDIEELNSSRT
jgi:hypothetical protein